MVYKADRTQVIPQSDITQITQIGIHDKEDRYANGPNNGERFKRLAGTTTILTDIEASHSIEALEEEFQEIVQGSGHQGKSAEKRKKPNHRVINDKQYVTLGVL